MKNLLTTSAIALLSTAMIPSANAVNLNFATEWSDKPGGANYRTLDGGRIHISPGPGINKNMEIVESQLRGQQVAQYYPQSNIQYQPPSFFQGSSGAPVVVPPTVINATPPVKQCREKRIGLLFIFEMLSSDC
jgi:hypothetical protein